jgi:hypothetical protein
LSGYYIINFYLYYIIQKVITYIKLGILNFISNSLYLNFIMIDPPIYFYEVNESQTIQKIEYVPLKFIVVLHTFVIFRFTSVMLILKPFAPEILLRFLRS